jgi:hypothetical protein
MVSDPAFENAVRRNKLLVSLITDDAVLAALKSGTGIGTAGARLKADNSLQTAIRSDGSVRFLKVIADDGIQAAFKNEQFRAFLADDALAAALRKHNGLFSALADDRLAASVHNADMMKALADNADFLMALRESPALTAAIRARPE